jgi:single-strand DNA-binding protein
MNQISIVGNLTADPTIRFSDDGKARATFTVAVNEGTGENERTHFVNVTAFGTLGENVAGSLHKGNRVVVVGRLNTYSRKFEVDGEEKNVTMTAVTASAVGPDLRWAVARVSKVQRDSANGSEPAAEAPSEPAEAPVRAASTNGSKRSGSKQAAAPAPSAADDDDF